MLQCGHFIMGSAKWVCVRRYTAFRSQGTFVARQSQPAPAARSLSGFRKEYECSQVDPRWVSPGIESGLTKFLARKKHTPNPNNRAPVYCLILKSGAPRFSPFNMVTRDPRSKADLDFTSSSAHQVQPVIIDSSTAPHQTRWITRGPIRISLGSWPWSRRVEGDHRSSACPLDIAPECCINLS